MFRRRTISFRNFLFLFAVGTVLVLLLLLAGISFATTKQFIEEKKQFIIHTRLNQVSFEVNNTFKNAYFALIAMKTNERLIGYIDNLSGSDKDAIEKYHESQEIIQYLQNVKQDNGFIDNILIVTPHTQFSSDQMYLDFDLNGIRAREGLESQFNFVPTGRAADAMILPGGASSGEDLSRTLRTLNEYMFFTTNFTYNDGSDHGVMIMLLDPDYFENKVPYHNNVVLLDRNNHAPIFMGDQVPPELLDELEGIDWEKEGGSLFLTGRSFEAHYTPLSFNGFRLVYVDQMRFYQEQNKLMVRLTIATMALAVLVASILSKTISNRVLYPVYKLMRLLQTYDGSDGKINYFRELGAGKPYFTLRERFMIFFLVTILLPLVLYISIFYWQTSTIVAEDLKKSHHSLFEKTGSLLAININQKEVLLAKISLDKRVQDLVAERETELLERELFYQNQHLGLNRDIVSLYDESGELLFSNRYGQQSVLDPVFYEKMRSSGRVISYHLTKDDLGAVSVVLGMPIISFEQFPSISGYVTVDVDSQFLFYMYSEFTHEGSDTFIMDRDQRIVSHSIPSQIGQTATLPPSSEAGDLHADPLTKEKYIVYRQEVGGVPWEFVSIYNYSNVEKQVNDLFLNDAYILFFIFLLIIVFSYWLSQRLMKPLGKLNRMFNEYDLGQSHIAPIEHLSGVDEVDLLGRNFNHMTRRIEDLMDEMLIANKERMKLEFEKKEIQMAALQSQINPHFLYNTLDNLIYLVETGESDKAADMINSLSRLFRYITNREQMIRVRDEIMYAKTYATIMSYRYDNFQCLWHIGDETLDCLTTKLILQPVIENAIHHGARKTTKPVNIEISCFLYDDTIRITVKDNAQGMRQDELQEVRSRLSASVTNKAGIYNVNERIRLNFGERYGLHIDSVYGEGTTVTILLPASL